LLLVAIAASVFAFYQTQKAEKLSQEAEKLSQEVKEQVEIAEKQRKIAEEQRKIAEKQRRVNKDERQELEDKKQELEDAKRELGKPFAISVYSGSRYKTRFYAYYRHPATGERQVQASGNIPRKGTKHITGNVHYDHDQIQVVIQRDRVVKWENLADFKVSPGTHHYVY
jgi:uncharacterized membrane-anchored protein YhcB (DUF1043 family)